MADTSGGLYFTVNRNISNILELDACANKQFIFCGQLGETCIKYL